jgi:integrase
MASIAKDPNGRKRILFFAGGKRRTVRLGKTDQRSAERIRDRIEQLVAAVDNGLRPDADTTRWLASIGDDLHGKLCALGLAEPRESADATLAELLDLCEERANVKPSTVIRYGQTARLLREHFGDDHPVRRIRPIDADGFRAWLLTEGYAPAKVSRDIGMARMFFKRALAWGMVEANPFASVAGGSQRNPSRQAFVDPETIERVIDAAPSHDWRCIIALARWGGLRCPSEILRVRWCDVSWDRNTVRVRSPKTEHHEGKAERLVPLFPELRDVLLPAFEAAEDGAEHVVAGYRDATNANLRTHLLRILDRAGVPAWPRLFNAMRASRATELAHDYPSAICSAWMGHSAAVAAEHYISVRDDDYAAASTRRTIRRTAAQNPAQHRAEPLRTESHDRSQTVVSGAPVRDGADPCVSVHPNQVGTGGLEPPTPAFSMPCSTN